MSVICAGDDVSDWTINTKSNRERFFFYLLFPLSIYLSFAILTVTARPGGFHWTNRTANPNALPSRRIGPRVSHLPTEERDLMKKKNLFRIPAWYLARDA